MSTEELKLRGRGSDVAAFELVGISLQIERVVWRQDGGHSSADLL
jgi:hypothetical protein